MRSLLVASLFLVPLLAGCVTPPDLNAKTGAAPLALNAPKVDAKATLTLLKDFSSAYPYRQTGEATHVQARDALEASMKKAGLETMRQKFPSHFLGPAPVSYDGENIIGIKWGDDRSHWVVVGGHYDITEGAVYGTYDDGSGTILTLKLGEAFAKINTTRTIAFIEFDQEERGLIGSGYFVKTILDQSFKAANLTNVTIDAMIDLDMVGITWPHPAHLVAWQNSPSIMNETKLLANASGVPEKNLEFRKPKGGSSDGASFIKVNLPTIYFWSDWDDVVTKDGQKVPTSYPFWHQADTYDTMVQAAGDEATLTKGFQTTLDIVSPLLLWTTSSAFTPDAVEAK